MNHTLDRWKPAGQNAGAAVLLVVVAAFLDELTWPILLAVTVCGVWAWWVSPLRRGRPHVDHAVAKDRAEADDLIVYWRPGCTYCIKLRRGLTDEVAHEVAWVNVMTDAEGGAYIRQFNNGNMVTPTAVTGRGKPIVADATSVTQFVSGA